MADNIVVTAGTGETVAADEVVDATLGTVKVQFVKIMDGALDGTAKVGVSSAGLKVDLGADNDVTLATLPDTAGGDLAAIKTAVEVIDNAISGTEMQVDVVSSALPSGAATETTLASAVTALQIMDDWDETDRAKVNIIAGQAGVTAGAGAVAANTPRVTLASDDPAVVALQTIDNAIAGNEMQVDVVNTPAVTNTHLTNFGAGEYETVAASQTAQTLGATGATGDFISHVLVIPASTSPGNVILLDNATSITIFAGGTDSVSDLRPFPIPLGMISVSGAWKITTGASVSVIGVGNFT